jgi:hypothetical protein
VKAGETQQCRRRDLEPPDKLVPAGLQDGDYWKNPRTGVWWLYLDGCGPGRLSDHKVIEHDDGTVTVSPSILISCHHEGHERHRHGYLEHGVWREV